MNEEGYAPPWSEVAEVSVLGALLMDSTVVPEVRAMLEPEDFHREGHRRIYRAISELFDQGGATDAASLAQHLEDKGDIDAVGGINYMGVILDAVPTAANVEHHAAIVREKAQLRRLMEVGQHLVQEAATANGAGPEGVVESAERRILQVTERRGPGGYAEAGAGVEEAHALLERAREAKGGVVGVPTGFPTLDRMTAGLQPGDLAIFAGRPGHGKTAWALGAATYAAARGYRVAIASHEMGSGQLVQRMIAARTGIDAQEIRRGLVDDRQVQAIEEAGQWIAQLPLWIDDQPAKTVEGLRAETRRQQMRRGLDLLVVDYLQQMHGPGDNRNAQVEHVSRHLKALARSLGIPVLALAQLSRAPEHRSPPRPQLSDLRDSGGIEQDADLVAMLWRPEVYFTDDTPDEKWAKWQGKAELLVTKQRNGQLGTILLDWQKETMRFHEPDITRDARW